MSDFENGKAVRTSVGTLGLSHFRNSRVSTSQWEPIYQNLFSVQLVAPEGLQDGSEDRVNTILEGVKSVGTIAASKGSAPVTQTYKFATRSFAGATPESTYIDLQIQFQLNLSYDNPNGTPSNYTYNFLRQWVDLVYDPLTGRQGLKREYASSQMIITMHDRAGTPFWQFIFYQIFPTTGAPQPTLDYTSGSLMEGSMTFRADWWDECSL